MVPLADSYDLPAALGCDLNLLLDANARVHLDLHRIAGCGDELRVVLFDSLNRVSQHLSDFEDADAASQHIAGKRISEAV